MDEVQVVVGAAVHVEGGAGDDRDIRWYKSGDRGDTNEEVVADSYWILLSMVAVEAEAAVAFSIHHHALVVAWALMAVMGWSGRAA
jgi:hypothetical protein